MPGAHSRLGGATADVAVPGGAIRVETLGSGPPIMFLHGWTLDRRVWAKQAEALASRYRIIAIDRRGSGQSTAPPDLAQEPADLVAIADFLGLDRFALVGMSQGARVALAFALRRDPRLASLVLQGAPLSGVAGLDDDLPIARMTELAQAGAHEALRALWHAHPLMQVDGASANFLLDTIADDYTGRDLIAPHTPLDVTEADLARIAVPALVITGANEPRWRHRVAATLHRALGAQRVDIAGAGHLANLCRPDAYNAALTGFFENQLRDAA